MLLVVGWDGACFELAQRFRADGRMPVLDALLARGCAWRVRSTVPAVTFPAWTSFLTAASPSHHGVTDFTIPRNDGYGVRFANATHRRLPTILARMAAAGLRVGMYGIPATYPPEGRAVFEICGFDTPLGASASGRATHPRALADELRRRHGRLGIEGIAQARIDDGWHERTRAQLVADVELRSRIAMDLVREHALDVFVVHFMEPDTAAHHYWQFDDDRSPRHRPGPRGVLGDVYAALDRSLGEIAVACGGDPDVLVLSDHGSAGASDRIVFWNRWLSDRGWLAFEPSSGEPAAARLKRRALAAIPPSLQARAFALAGRLADRIESSARFAGIDWSRTRAYSDEVPYFPSVRLNLAGRERDGIVRSDDRERVLSQLAEDLLAARDPFDGGPVVEAVRRREDLFEGPFADRYPDLVLELRRPDGYAYAAGSSRVGRERAWLRRLADDERSGARGQTTSGVHSPQGMAVLAGAGAGRAFEPGATLADLRSPLASIPECTLPDLGATVLALAGVAVPAGLQGRPLVKPATTKAAGPASPADEPVDEIDYDEDDEREVERRLRALGYLP